MGNEDQDTVALLEKCADVDKGETRLREAQRYSVESTDVRGGRGTETKSQSGMTRDCPWLEEA
jgi:hypothetical protein